MKYKKGDDIYLKGQIVGVSSCSGVAFPYEVLIADGFIDVKEKDIVSVNEPEKPVVPQFVADWLEVCKENLAVGLSIAMRFSFLAANDQPEETIQWFKSPSNQETFAKAWLYGYEVEKEKLYTVFQPATNEFLYTEPSGSLRSDAVTWTYAAETEEYHFTQQKLEELHYWANPAFEIKEVKQ